jgi:hypothetical protein
VQVVFVLKDGNNWHYNYGHLSYDGLITAQNNIASVSGSIVGPLWGGEYFNWAIASLVTDKYP